MKKLKFLILLVSIGFFASCSSDETTPALPPASSPITLTSDVTTITVGESATLTVTNSSGTNVTGSSTFMANEVAISGNVFTPATAGTYYLKAKKGSKTSNSVTIVVNPTVEPITSITVTSNKSSVSTGENVTFTVTANNGENLTSQSTIYFDDVAQTGSVIAMPTAGVVNVTAKYTDANSVVMTAPAIQITVTTIINFNKRVLVEDFTGTWCGYCPRVAYGIEQVEAQTTDAVPVAIHQGSDPYNISVSPYDVSGYPTANLNRRTEWNYPEPSNVSQVVNLTTGTNPKLGLALNPTISGGNVTFDVKVKFGYQFSNLKLVVYILEDGLVYNQTNYTSYYGGTSTITNMTHNHVLRKVLTNINGDVITSAMNSGDEYTKNFNVVIPANVTNTANMSVVAFVMDSSGKALNVRSAHIGESQTFEIE